jgi:hypothetical protein
LCEHAQPAAVCAGVAGWSWPQQLHVEASPQQQDAGSDTAAWSSQRHAKACAAGAATTAKASSRMTALRIGFLIGGYESIAEKAEKSVQIPKTPNGII